MAKPKAPVIDCCVYHDWMMQSDLVEYMPRAWSEALGLTTKLPRGLKLRRLDPINPYRNPDGDVLPDSTATGYPGPVGVTEPAAAATKRDVGAAVLIPGSGRYVPTINDARLSVALCAAINDWTIDRWLSGQDDRLWGSILVPAQLPDKAAEEIRRVGRHPRMVQVLLSGNGLSKPFGHDLYSPILEAAVELEMPVAIDVGADAPADTLSFATAIGPPTTYSEYRVLSAQALMTHVVHLIGQGVFEKLPTLRVLLVGGGIGWIPPTIWRADEQFGAWGRTAPWAKRKPSEYFRDCIRVATYQFETSPPNNLAVLCRAFEGLEDLLCYGSGYPAIDSHAPAAVEAVLPEGVANKILRDNPRRLYGSRMTAEHTRVSQP